MELDPFGWLGIDLDLGRVEQTSRQSEPELPLKSVRGATGEKAGVCDDRFATDAHRDRLRGGREAIDESPQPQDGAGGDRLRSEGLVKGRAIDRQDLLAIGGPRDVAGLTVRPDETSVL